MTPSQNKKPWLFVMQPKPGRAFSLPEVYTRELICTHRHRHKRERESERGEERDVVRRKMRLIILPAETRKLPPWLLTGGKVVRIRFPGERRKEDREDEERAGI